MIESVPPGVVKLIYQPATPEEAIRAVGDLVANGADIIKLFVVSWVRRDGKITLKESELVLQGHVDVLAHATEDPDQWNAALVKRLKSASVSLIPTLTLFSGENGPDAAHEGILREVKSYADAGGKILFGTDVGYEDYSLLATGKGVIGRFVLDHSVMKSILLGSSGARPLQWLPW